MPFLMIRNGITKVTADAIVNPANRNLLQGSGTSHAIYQAAGEQELTAACEAIGHCEPGRAVCTPAFGLPAKYIFHAVCPAWHGGFFGEAKQLAGAYHSALELAAEYHCESVAFPLLSSGNYGCPKEQAFRIAVDTITQYVMEHDLTVYLVLYDRHSLAVSRKLFTSVEEYIDDHYVAQNDESYQFDRWHRELAERRRRLEEDTALADREYRKNSKTPACVLCAKYSTRAGVVLLWFVRTVRTGRNIIFVEFRPADTGYRDGRFPLLPAPAWRAQRGCADGGTLPAAPLCSGTAYPR